MAPMADFSLTLKRKCTPSYFRDLRTPKRLVIVYNGTKVIYSLRKVTLSMYAMDGMPPDQYVNVGSIRTRYWKIGNEGPPLIFVHGILRFAEDWLLNMPTFARHYQVYALDLVGYGRTDKPDIDYEFFELAKFLDDFMTVLGIEKATLVGHSMGGGVVLAQACHHPEKVDKLVLVSSVGFGRNVHKSLRFATLPGLSNLFAVPPRPFIAQAFKEVIYDSKLITPELVDYAYEMFCLPGWKRAISKTLLSNLSLGGIREDLFNAVKKALPRIEAPTLIIWGRQDPVMSYRHGYAAAEWIRGAELRILDECRHFPMWEHPEIFNALLQEFLAPETISVPKASRRSAVILPQPSLRNGVFAGEAMPASFG